MSQNRSTRLDAALRAAFRPSHLEIVNDSARHAGHAGAAGNPGGETHFNVLIVSSAFVGQTRVARSRAVHNVLSAELAQGLHALALTLKTPEEFAAES